MSIAAASLGRRTNARWLMVFMAFMATTINYIDRANLSVAMPDIAKEYSLSGTQQGLLMGAFFWTYAAFQLPSGWFIDKVGVRFAYAAAVVWWSFFTAASALGRGLSSLIGIRLLLGAGEAPAYPCNAKIVAEWFPRQERALATSFFDSGSRFGNALALPIVTGIIAAFGWRMAFVITGALGFLWTVFWLKIYRNPKESKLANDAERAYIEAGAVGAEKGKATIRWVELFQQRTVVGMMIGFFCLNFVIYFFSTWFPVYLREARHFDLKKAGIVGMIPALASIPCGYLGGWVSDRLVKSGMPLSRARKIPLVGGMLTSSVIGLVVVVESNAAVLALLSLSYGSLAFAAASVWSLPGDVAPSKDYVASIGGIQNFASNLAGVCIALGVGVLFQKTGGFVIPLVLAGCFSLLGAFAYLVIVPEIGPLKPKTRAV